ncbi:MAG: 3-hydroxyacyl-CoA dehydrogenase family protein [Acidobacteria bacterium]|nr:3-hydroxyacyl-CoA dehydrogenase family protein [Acidobacteriota bacterium]MCI0567337.1 3-hydroxyacyl-CoA dehydrogenase family protein [Acidobacteriota bacterium]
MAVVRAAEIQRVAVAGAGTMGHGIARVAAQSGFEVRLFDGTPGVADAALEKIRSSLEEGVKRGKVSAREREETLSRLSAKSSLQESAAGAELVIEAIPERMELKELLFSELGRICSESALLGSNTSSLSLSRIARSTVHPERVVGLHFFNPPHRMKLLEVVRGEATSDAAVETALGVARKLGKDPIVVKDSPGFATSRLGVALGLEAMRMLEEGIAVVEDIDKAMELGYGHPMGPLRVSDLVGLDVRLSIAEALHRELGGSRFEPPQILRDKVRMGKLGKKSGAGFYPWEK